MCKYVQLLTYLACYPSYLIVLCRYNVQLLPCYLVCYFSYLPLAMMYHGCHCLLLGVFITFRNFHFLPRVLSQTAAVALCCCRGRCTRRPGKTAGLTRASPWPRKWKNCGSCRTPFRAVWTCWASPRFARQRKLPPASTCTTRTKTKTCPRCWN